MSKSNWLKLKGYLLAHMTESPGHGTCFTYSYIQGSQNGCFHAQFCYLWCWLHIQVLCFSEEAIQLKCLHFLRSKLVGIVRIPFPVVLADAPWGSGFLINSHVHSSTFFNEQEKKIVVFFRSWKMCVKFCIHFFHTVLSELFNVHPINFCLTVLI